MEGLRVAVVGAGYMGSAHARVLARIREDYPGLIEGGYVVDVDLSRARRVAARYGWEPLGSVDQLPGRVDFAFVVVPTRLHLEVSLRLLERGVGGLLVEKPLTSTAAEAARLLEAVEKAGAWAAVGHIERVNPAVWALHRAVGRGLVGDVLGASARRVGPYAPRAGDIDVVHDLAVHEADNLMALFSRLPDDLAAYVYGGLVSGLADHALLVAGFDGRYASVEVSRITPYKQRLLHLTGSKAVAELDYMAQRLIVHTEEGETLLRVEREEPLYLEDLIVLLEYRAGARSILDASTGAAAVAFCDAALSGGRGAWDTVSGWTGDALEAYHRYSKAARGHRGPMDYAQSLIR